MTIRLISQCLLGSIGAIVGFGDAASGQDPTVNPLTFCQETLVGDPDDLYCSGFIEGYNQAISVLPGTAPGTFAGFATGAPAFVMTGQEGSLEGEGRGAVADSTFYVPTNPVAEVEWGAPSDGSIQYLYKPYSLEEFANSNFAEQFGVAGIDQEGWTKVVEAFRTSGLEVAEDVAAEMGFAGIEAIEGVPEGQGGVNIIVLAPTL